MFGLQRHRRRGQIHPDQPRFAVDFRRRDEGAEHRTGTAGEHGYIPPIGQFTNPTGIRRRHFKRDIAAHSDNPQQIKFR